MKNILTIIIVFSMFSCTKDFQEINTNPNAPIDVQPSLLLRQVIYNYGEEMSYEGFVAGNLLGQYFTAIDFNLFDRHSLTEPQFGGNPWPVFYKNLRDNEILLSKSRNESSAKVYEGPALILKAYMTAALTDIYGDVPYTEALNGKAGETLPKYDLQSDIYLGPGGILDNLSLGIQAINAYQGGISLEGDILFEGDLAAWKVFAYALRLKYWMRISDREDVSDNIVALLATGELMEENTQNATFDFTDGQPNNFRMANLRAGDFNLFVMSETAEEILKNNDDPRMSTFYRGIGDDPSGETFNGLLNGPDASQTSISVSDFSLTGTIFREETGRLDANFMTAWEFNFLLAEAAEKEIINHDAQTYYEQGIILAFEYWGVNMPDDYLERESVKYVPGSEYNLEKIITQKWIANTINGYEGWIEYRRTGFPKLKNIDASLNNDIIPVRMPYPTDEAALNAEAYNEAAGRYNGNSINSKVWWD